MEGFFPFQPELLLLTSSTKKTEDLSFCETGPELMDKENAHAFEKLQGILLGGGPGGSLVSCG